MILYVVSGYAADGSVMPPRIFGDLESALAEALDIRLWCEMQAVRATVFTQEWEFPDDALKIKEIR